MDDPRRVQHEFARHKRELRPIEGDISLSVRGLPAGSYKITRLQTRPVQAGDEPADPWRQWDEIPEHTGGILGELIADESPKLLRGVDLAADPVLGDVMAGYRSVMAVPLFDDGLPLNWAFVFGEQPTTYGEEDLEQFLMRGNLIGRMTKNLVMRREVEELNARLLGQLEEIAIIQRSLLPERTPQVRGLAISTSYLTSQEAGGDYFDFFDLPGDRWGVVIADAAGHGAGAATVVAMLQTILHAHVHDAPGPAALLRFANAELARKRIESTFVTAFLGVFDERRRELVYANAGHNRPALRRASGDVEEITGAASIPLGILQQSDHGEATIDVDAGDTLVLYTDGITEAFSPPPETEMFSQLRLYDALRECSGAPHCVIDTLHEKLFHHTRSRARKDDQTIVAIRVED